MKAMKPFSISEGVIIVFKLAVLIARNQGNPKQLQHDSQAKTNP
ncbi:hypothetical protein [Secundilactobacillus pentosiphilus]|nr:hypothetical protein [Secundilactobacillus pentosiphilus]